MANFSFTDNGNLRIELLRGDKTKIKEWRKNKKWCDDDVFLELVERQLCNGWENIYELACWSNRINLTQDHETDDYGDTIRLGKVYTYTDYCLRSEIDALLEDGEVILTMYE